MLLPQDGAPGVTDQAREHLARVLASPLFARSPRQSSFLRFVVEKALAGEQEQIKEYEIAVNVYGRRRDHSNQADPIVRVEASRLRSKLLEYYSTEGRHEEFRIELPKGTYVPEFVAVPAGAPAESGGRTAGGQTEGRAPAEESAVGLAADVDPEPGRSSGGRLRRKLGWLAAIAATAAAVGFIWSLVNRTNGSPLTVPHSKVPSSIAVMPLLDQTPGRPQPRLSGEVTEALITEMRQRNWPEWHTRSSTINGDPSLPRQKADAVFSGSVVVDGGILRVLGSLEDLSSKVVLWNGAVERKLADWPEAERGFLFEDIAQEINDKLIVALMERQEEELAVLYPRRVEARQAWLEGDGLRRRGDADSIRQAIPLFKKAVALDPNFAWIHASLATTLIRAVELGLAPEESYRREAREHAARAMQLAPYLAMANYANVRVALMLDWNIQAATASCTGAMNMLSAVESVRTQCAELYALDGRYDDAAALELRSIRRSGNKSIHLANLASVRYRWRQFEEAQALAEKSLSWNNNYVRARCVLALAQMGAHQHQHAVTRIRSGAADRSGRLAALAATALALLGDRQGAETELLEAERQLVRPDRADLIRPYLALGLADRARAAVEEALSQRNPRLLELLVDPQIAELDRKGLFDRVRARRK